MPARRQQLAAWGPMSRRQRSRGHLHALADPGEPADAPQPGAELEPDLGLFALDGLAASGPADGQSVPVEDIIRQLEALGMPPDLVAKSRALDDDHRAELAGMLDAATAMLAGDPVAGLISLWRPLLDREVTAFDAEMATAQILWSFDAAGEDDLVDGLTLMIEQARHIKRPEVLVMLRMLAHLGPPEVHDPATRAANTLAAGGIKDRPWVSSLGKATFHRAYGFTDEGGRVLAVEFGHGKRHHAFVFLLDETQGCVVGLYASDEVDELHRQIRLEAVAHQLVPSTFSAVEAAEVIRSALDQPFRPGDEEDEAEMEGIVPILRERLGHLPQAGAPEPAGDRTPPPVVHRIKVTLAGFKPPVWRRLEVPSEMTLLSLHDVLQLSFGWNDTHLWQFTAAKQVYGIGDIGVPHRDAKKVTIGDLAPRPGATFDYVYDFGDEWRHRIRVEQVGPGDPGAGYPRCLSGRSAAPQEDSYGFADEDDDDEPFDVVVLNDRLSAFAARRRRR
jgi:hypothetical protein